MARDTFDSVLNAFHRLESVIAKIAQSQSQVFEENKRSADEINKKNREQADKINKINEDRAKKINESIDESNEKSTKINEMINESIGLKTKLSGASTMGANMRIIKEILDKNLGGEAQSDIRTNFKRFNDLRKLAVRKDKEAARLGQLATAAQANAQNPNPAVAQRWKTIQAARAASATSATKAAAQFRSRSRASLMIARRNALGPRGLRTSGQMAIQPHVTTSKVKPSSKSIPAGAALAGIFTKLAGVGGIAIQALSKLSNTFKESQEIIHHFSTYSQGAMQSLIISEMGEINRNVKTSQELSGSMMRFAEANNRMQDSFRRFDSFLNKFKLNFSSSFADVISTMSGRLEDWTDAVDKQFDKFKDLPDWVKNAITSGFGIMAPVILNFLNNWNKDKDAAQERIDRRKQFFQNRDINAVKPDDLDPLESQLFEKFIDPAQMKELNEKIRKGGENRSKRRPNKDEGPGAPPDPTQAPVPLPPKPQNPGLPNLLPPGIPIGWNNPFENPILNPDILKPGKGWNLNDTV